ncbi:MAG TPA: pilus assembly protein TadG-related protein [Pseudolabrys sp.]|nr:pilus assembly protein TadG-related protein [Pseudolabrys sp.]
MNDLWRANGGSVAIQLALSSLVILGMVALAVEITFLVYKHRQMQAAADAAAFGAAIAKKTGYPSSFALEARAAAAEVGYVNGVNGVTVTVNNPPLHGNYTANNSAVEVIISQSQSLSLVTLFQTGLFSVGASAVAMPGGGGSACVLQLLSTNITGVSLSNGATVNLAQCGLDANATSSSAVSVIGGATLNTQFVSTSGRTSVSQGGAINATNGIKTNQPAVADPYASVPAPSYSGCNFNNKSFGHSATRQYASPGVYCNGLAFTNDALVTMNPGVYIIDRGSFNVGGAVQLTGTGVTIYLTKSTGSSYATVSIGNGATVTLSAPTSGTYAGLTFFGDRKATTSTTSSFGGGATLSITGALYFPSQTVSFNNGISNPSGCTQLIAGQIQFTGGAQFKNNCANTGVISVGGGQTSLVE